MVRAFNLNLNNWSNNMIKIQAQLDAFQAIYKPNVLGRDIQDAGLLKALSKVNLFTKAASSAKLAKNLKFTKYESYILYMSPATMAFDFIGRRGTLCPFASDGCKAACLNTAGRGRFSSVANARLRKALYFITYRDVFVAHVFSEVAKLRAKAIKNKTKLVIRLNGTTDINWMQPTHNGANIFDTFKDVQFYDYTKNLQYALKANAGYKNYNVTFSASEVNHLQVGAALDADINVAMVFNAPVTTWQGDKVINGDDHDLRFLDGKFERGVIVGLTAKGNAKKDKSGFVRSTCGGPRITQKVVLNFMDVKNMKGA